MADGLDARLRPRALHPTAGATLVAARPPLVAFNLELGAAGDRETTRGAIAAPSARAASEGLPGLRAIGLTLAARGDVAQVSCNVEDHEALPLARAARGRRAPRAGRARPSSSASRRRPPSTGLPERVPIRNRATHRRATRA